MQNDEMKQINFETIQKRKLLNLMGSKLPYDVRSQSNLYKSRPNTTNTNLFNDTNLSKSKSNSRSQMNASRSAYKLDNLQDLSNIKQYKSKNNNIHNNKDNKGLIHIGPSMSRPPSHAYEYLKHGSPLLNNTDIKLNNTHLNHTNTDSHDQSNSNIKRSNVNYINKNKPKLKLNLNTSQINQDDANLLDSVRNDFITEKALDPNPKNTSSERKDRVDSYPKFEVDL